MRNLLISIWLSLVIAPLTHAEVTKVIEAEQALESRIGELVHRVDADAQIFVKVKLKVINIELPGTGLDFNGTTAVQRIEAEDIEEIHIRIVTSLAEFPEWLKTQIESHFKFSTVKTTLEIETYQPQVMEQILSFNPGRKILHWLSENIEKSQLYVLIFLGIFVAAFLTLVSAVFFYLPKILSSAADQLISGVKSVVTDSADNENISQEVLQAKDVAETTTSAGAGQVRDGDLLLPVDGLIELFADCYWTERDQYANWLWTHLNSDQKLQVLAGWGPLQRYSQFFLGELPEVANFHSHPYYLKPSRLREINMQDLEAFLQKNTSAWGALSPLRQKYMKVGLNKKINMVLAQDKGSSQVEWPKPSANLRDLVVATDLGELTFDDDAAILAEPDMIPDNMKPQAASLVWVAMLPEEERQKILGALTALQLAQVLVGPYEVLNTIKSSLPEKKRKLVESYSGKVSASRTSDLFKKFTREAAVQWLKSREKPYDAAKAS